MYSKYHPDNMHEKVDISLPPPIKAPESSSLYAELTERDRKIPGVYGHKLCAELPDPHPAACTSALTILPGSYILFLPSA